MRNEIVSENALSIFRDFTTAVFEDGLIAVVPFDADLSNRSLKLAIEEKITVYDAAFIELAHRRN